MEEKEIGLGFNLAKCLLLFPECNLLDAITSKMIGNYTF